ncbi:sensor histidine kinase [Runella slithyformis]|uniref:Signal transduction histidine kinase n=1 Tax=Runella slithyformis (strain ATCC 29530 / DSM 19594 / LMG 11500 / NCIMB 11436 / LSU 4) TaxID=761193 RepID=A0A7U3ZII0_RUNSL|nr:histidine kinase [Runella slithyformis]AEI47817.1 putative signal transduction histidine kinase [Runella slithyformis DSM 19594]
MRLLPYSRLVFFLLVITFSGYLGFLLYGSLKAQFGNDEESLSGFGKFLLSYVLLVAVVWGVGWLNYRGPFRRWFLTPEKRWGYWTWIVALTWGVFELLQLRQDRDPEFVDENSLVTLVLTGIIIGFGYIADAFRVRREQLVLQQQKTEAELTALKSQINPHFLFNTLNTIYNEAAGAQNDTVADLVQQLASIMRFTLQESAKPFISVESELAFLDKYLTLQRARLPQRDSIRVDIHMDYDGQPARIAPLLLIPFVENAFQYGISFENPCFVKINLVIENQTLTLQLQNSTFPKATHRKGHGMGIHNVRQRLKLIYPHQYTLEIKDEGSVFEIQMSIKL